MTVHHPSTYQEYHDIKATPSTLIVVDFSAQWCGPCKQIAPRFQALADLYPEVLFVHVDVDQLDSLEDGQDVSAVPTFKFYCDNHLLGEFSGANITRVEETLKKLTSA